MFGRVRRSPVVKLASFDRANLGRSPQFGLDSGVANATASDDRANLEFGRLDSGIGDLLDGSLETAGTTATFDRANLLQKPQFGLDSGIGIPNGTASVDRARDNGTTGQAQNISKGRNGTGTAVIR